MLDSDKSTQGVMVVRSRLKELVLNKEIAIGRKIKNIEICEATGLNAHTVARWMSPAPFERFEVRPVVALCEWLDIGVGDLLIVERVRSA